MLALLERYQRTWAGLGFFLVFGISGILTLASNIEVTGALLLFSAFFSILKLPIFWLFKRKKWLQTWLKKENKFLQLWIGIICLVGVLNSYQSEIVVTIIYAELLGFLLIYWFLDYRSRKHGQNVVKQTKVFNIIFGVLIVSFTINITIAVLYEDGDIIELFAPFYLIAFIVMSVYWVVRQIQGLLKLKSEQSKMELLHLKSQVNPHFFFNMLNNLYGLVEIDSKKAQALILKLSDMMRYSIYEGQKEWVSLEEEVEYLKNYIELHKMRYHKEIMVEFNIDIEEEGYKVMPLFYIILLENAFKHGVEKLRKGAFVKINLQANANKIDFTIENNFSEKEDTNHTGIGLENLSRRLELVYPNKHVLLFSVAKDVYKAQLSILQS